MKKNKEPFFSIILPVFNVSQYLAKCLDSILNQSFKSYEIICVDDGSTDNSGDICDEYSNKFANVKVFHKENEGLGLTRNYGLLKSSGEYIFFVDSDDFIPGYKCLENIYNKLHASDIQLLCINFCSWSFETKEFDYSREVNITGVKSIESEIAANRFTHSARSKIIKREFLIGNNILFQKGISEDFVWTSKMLDKNPVIDFLNDDYYYCYRNFRKNSLTQTYNVTYLETWANIIDQMYGLYINSKNSVLKTFISKSYFDIFMTFTKKYPVDLINKSPLAIEVKRTYQILNNKTIIKSFYLYMMITMLGVINTIRLIKRIKK